MRVVIETPIKAYLHGASPETLERIRSFLSYSNTANLFTYRRTLNNRWLKKKDPDQWAALCKEQKADIKKSLLSLDGNGYYIRPGSVPYLIEEGFFTQSDVSNMVKYPELKPMPWAKVPKYTLYPYQASSVEKLIAERHGCVNLCTGAGKALTLITIARNMGLKTLIVVPSQSTFLEMVKNCELHLGKGNVGMLGDGKKKTDKKIIVCISKSLTTLKSDSEHYKNIKEAQVMLIDETHTFGAETLDTVCHGILSDVPYRFFFTGTHTRGDGALKLLESITGRIVETLTTKEAVDGGYISDHEFRIVKTLSSDPEFYSGDGIAMKRKHFLRNKNIADFIAKLSESVYNSKKEKTLVLVDEIGQIADLIKKLKIPYAYAHSDSKKDELKKLGLVPVDVEAEVERFNKGEVAILIGTSCIATGTNIYPVHHCINWAGGTSEIKTKQGAVGRSVRKLNGSGFEHLHPEKTKAIIWDFDIKGIESMEKQLKERVRYYKHSGTPIKEIG